MGRECFFDDVETWTCWKTVEEEPVYRERMKINGRRDS